MEFRKNDLVTLEIEDCGIDGEGIGKADGFTVFVKDAVIGDTVTAKIIKAKKNYGYGRLMEVLKPSPYRVEPKCEFARQCGGCQLQALSYDQQLVFKTNKVKGHLERIGGFTDIPMEPIIGMDELFHYRNKAQFPVGRNKEGKIVTGFYAGRTHNIIENRDCALGVAENKEVLDRVIAHMEKYGIEPYNEATGKGLVRHVLVRYGFTTKEIMVCLIINGDKLPSSEKLLEKLTKIPGMTSITYNINKEKTNVIMGSKVCPLWGQTYITDYIGNVKYQISPLSFYQVNPVQTEVLYGTALEYAGLTGKETVWDVYCGIGTISLFLAQKAQKVYGVEIVPQAIEDAKSNAALNGITNASFFVGKAEEVLPEFYEKESRKPDADMLHPDVIVVDPPRKGCDEKCLETMLRMEPDRIVYVSCDPATLARDLKILCGGGYDLRKVRPVDQFGHTTHVETVVLLSKGMFDSRKVKVDFSLEDMDLSEFKGKAIYEQIKAYVLEQTGLKVSSLYIAQIKKKCGLDVGENFNLPKSENARQPQCTPEKEEAIMQAFKHFGIV